MPKLLSCPHCGYTRSWVVRRHHRKCKQCRHEWSPPNRFFVGGYRLSADEWRRLVGAFLRDGTIVRVVEVMRRSSATVQKAVALIRQAMTNDVPFLFSGVCEADETYVGAPGKTRRCISGGKERNAVAVRANKRYSALPVVRPSRYESGSSLTRNDGHSPAHRMSGHQGQLDLYRWSQTIPHPTETRISSRVG